MDLLTCLVLRQYYFSGNLYSRIFRCMQNKTIIIVGQYLLVDQSDSIPTTSFRPYCHLKIEDVHFFWRSVQYEIRKNLV